MDAKTLKALKGSIAKWEKIASGVGSDKGTGNCPLCKIFYAAGCEDCPVFMQTGETDCWDTPFREWSGLGEPDTSGKLTDKNGKRALTDHAKSIAQREVDFLESLLPAQLEERP